jgi:hypothetical protein
MARIEPRPRRPKWTTRMNWSHPFGRASTPGETVAGYCHASPEALGVVFIGLNGANVRTHTGRILAIFRFFGLKGGKVSRAGRRHSA